MLMKPTKRSGRLTLGAAIFLFLPLAACGGIPFEEYPSITATEKTEARSTAGTASSLSPTPEFITDPGQAQAQIAWMDHLKTCAPYSEAYQNPFMHKLVINSIHGWDGDYCLVTMITTDMAIATCWFDADGIKALTRDELYAAMVDIYNINPDAPSNEVFSNQCEFAAMGPTEVK
jgi:hypothetical protein